VDTRHRDAVASAALLEALTPVFEQGAFKAPKIDRIIPLSEGRSAYEQVARVQRGAGLSWRPEVASVATALALLGLSASPAATQVLRNAPPTPYHFLRYDDVPSDENSPYWPNDFWSPLKFIPLDDLPPGSYINFRCENRERVEYFNTPALRPDTPEDHGLRSASSAIRGRPAYRRPLSNIHPVQQPPGDIGQPVAGDRRRSN
jgi:hypothetical protein